MAKQKINLHQFTYILCFPLFLQHSRHFIAQSVGGRFASQLYYGTQVSNRQCVHEPLEIRSHSARIQQQNIEPIRKTSHTTESKRKSTIKGLFEIPPQRKTYPMRRRMAVWGMWTERGRPGPAAHECGPTGGHMQRICTGQVTLSTQLLENGHQFGQMFVG